MRPIVAAMPFAQVVGKNTCKTQRTFPLAPFLLQYVSDKATPSVADICSQGHTDEQECATDEQRMRRH